MRERTRIYLIACTMLVMVLAGVWGMERRAWAKDEVFSGVIEEVDLKTGKLVVKTDVGKAVELEVVKPELLKDIGKGERVTVQMDEKNKAKKIMKDTPIPEIKGPGTPQSLPEAGPGGR